MSEQTTLDPSADNPGGEAQRPEWLPDNFTRPEDLVKSYQESQRKISEQGQRLAAIEENYNDLLERMEAQPQRPAVDPNSERERLMEAFESDPIGTMAFVAQQVAAQQVGQFAQQTQQQLAPQKSAQAEIIADFATRELGTRYSDFEAYQEKMADKIREQPWLYPEDQITTPAQAAGVLDNIYKMVKAEDLMSGSTIANQVAQQQAQAKQLAQTASGAGVRPPSPDDDKAYWDRVKAAGPKPYWQGLDG